MDGGLDEVLHRVVLLQIRKGIPVLVVGQEFVRLLVDVQVPLP